MAAPVRNMPLARFSQVFTSKGPFLSAQLNFRGSGVLLRQPRVFLTKNPNDRFRKQGGTPSNRAKYTFFAVAGLTVIQVGLFIKKYEAAESERPKHKPVRRIRSSTDDTGLKLTLYQYQSCPFCCKARAYLDYKGLSYDVIEVNSVWRTQTKWSKYKKVPILVCDGQGEDGFLQLNDSSVIMSALETFITAGKLTMEEITQFYPMLEMENEKGKKVREFPNKYFLMFGDRDMNTLPTTERQRKEERQWREWVDKVLVHTLSPNIYRTPSEAVQAFNSFSEVGEWERVFSTLERKVVIYLGSSVMYFIGLMLKRKYKLKNDVRESLYDACDEWTRAIGNNRKFLGGDQPNLADLSVYGVLSAIEGCSAFDDMMTNTHMKDWYYKTKTVVKANAGMRLEEPLLDGPNYAVQ